MTKHWTLLLLALLLAGFPLHALAADASPAPKCVLLALSDDLNDLADPTEPDQAVIGPNADNPYYQPDESRSSLDTGEKILYGIIGLVILTAVGVVIYATTGRNRRRPQEPKPQPERKAPPPPASPKNEPPAAVFCTSCGKPVPPGDRFCPHCGAPQNRR